MLKFRRKGDDGGIELVVSWGIEIDEGGEAESVLAADVRLPVYCEFPFLSSPVSEGADGTRDGGGRTEELRKGGGDVQSPRQGTGRIRGDKVYCRPRISVNVPAS